MESSIYRMRQQDVLAVCVLALLALGVIMVQSASTSLNGSVVRAPADTSPRLPGVPAAVANLVAAAGKDGIELCWDPDLNPNIAAYKIYRADVAGSAENPAAYAPLETLHKPHCRYKDESATVGRPSHYRVVAVDDIGEEGVPTFVSAARPGTWNWTILASRHITYVITAVLLFLVVGHVDYFKLARPDAPPWRSPVIWATGLAVLACVAVLVPGIGKSINGATRWIKLGPVQVQPSELAKWAAVLFLSYWMTRPAVDLRRFFRGFLPTLVPIGMLCLLVVIQDFGTAALIGLCAMTMLLAGRVKLWHLLAVALPAAMAGVWFIAHKEYRLRRIMAFRDPYASPQGEGYHMIQSLLSFTTGGLFGKGLGNGVQKLGYLPEDTTDFIFAVICEELGLCGAMLTIALYCGILYVAWQVVKQKRDDFGRLLAFGTASMLGLQAAINIAVATVSVPTKGLSLPLVSAGGSGLVITCAALGLLYSVSRHGRAEVEETPLMARRAAAAV